jgi:glycopeptide antibiotics resistance protein
MRWRVVQRHTFNFRLKDVLITKNTVMAGTFACMAVLMPFASHLSGLPVTIHLSSSTVAALLAHFIFFKISLIQLFFDVRNLEPTEVQTSPLSLPS